MKKGKTLTRGQRNCNPLNIRKSATRFSGEADGTDKEFKTFRTMAWGYRAAITILNTYYKRYKLDTIGKMISRWAPSNENDTNNYIATVCRRTGIPRGQKIHFYKSEIVAIVSAMSYMENGVNAKQSEVEEGWLMFVGG